MLSAGSPDLGDRNSNKKLHKSSWSFGLITMPINLTHPTSPNTLMSPVCYLTAASHTKTFATTVNSPTSNGTTPPTATTFSNSTAFPFLAWRRKQVADFHHQPHELHPPHQSWSTSMPATLAQWVTSPTFFNRAAFFPAPSIFLTTQASSTARQR